jgi:hypothetical protein
VLQALIGVQAHQSPLVIAADLCDKQRRFPWLMDHLESPRDPVFRQ